MTNQNILHIHYNDLEMDLYYDSGNIDFPYELKIYTEIWEYYSKVKEHNIYRLNEQDVLNLAKSLESFVKNNKT